MVAVMCQAKALYFSADGGNTQLCCSPLEDVVVVLLSVSGFQTNTRASLDLNSVTLSAVSSLEGVVVELNFYRAWPDAVFKPA